MTDQGGSPSVKGGNLREDDTKVGAGVEAEIDLYRDTSTLYLKGLLGKGLAPPLEACSVADNFHRR